MVGSGVQEPQFGDVGSRGQVQRGWGRPALLLRRWDGSVTRPLVKVVAGLSVAVEAARLVTPLLGRRAHKVLSLL